MASDSDELELDVDDDADDSDVSLEVASRPKSDDEEPGETGGKPRKRGSGVLSKLRGRPRRPGDQDPLQSPFVMWLVGGTVALLLIAAVLWFVIGRYRQQQAFNAAKAEMDGRRYRQAVALYDRFLEQYPHGELAETAHIDLARAAVLREIDTATPDWPAGLAALNTFLVDYRDRRAFEDETLDLKGDAFANAKRIALGTAEEARRSEKRDLLPIYEEARPLALRYAPPDEVETLEKSLDQSLARAERAIHRRETYDAAMSVIDAALAAGDPLAALDARGDLLDQFADYSGEPVLAERFDQALVAERGRIRVDALDQPAIVEEGAGDLAAGTTLVLHSRAREDQPVGSDRVVAVAGGTLFGCDATTGTPIWRRTVGVDQPFFPIRTEGATAGVLVFDTRAVELVHVAVETGELLWRQATGDRASAAPLVSDDGLILQPTANGGLYQIELETGRLIAVAQCPQPTVGTPASLAGNRVLVAGDRNIAYLFGTRPLTLESLVHLGHRAGTMAEVVPMGPYVLTIENDRHDAARLQLFAADLADENPAPIAAARVGGRVNDPVAVRGNQLVVPFGRERLATFVVTAEDGRPPLVAAATLDRPGADVEVFLLPGPGDEIWVASTALRRYRILADTIQQIPGEAAYGQHTQPMQSLGERMFVGHRPPHASPVYFTELDRRSFVGAWRCVLADRLVASMPAGDGALVAATESGQVYRLAAGDLAEGGFATSAAFSAPLLDRMTNRLFIAAGDDGLAIVGVDKEKQSRLWVVNRVGVLDWSVDLPAYPQCPPAPLAGGFVLAFPGKLSLVLRSRARVDDYQANVAVGEETRWVAVVAAGKEAVVAQDADGNLVKIEYRPQPLPHLSAVGNFEPQTPVHTALGANESAVAVVDESNTLRILSTNRFEPLGEHDLGSAPARPPWVVANLVLVETRDGNLHGFGFGFGAGAPWKVSLAGGALAGQPLLNESGLLVALRDGRLLSLVAATGEVTSTRTVQDGLAGGPLHVGERVVVPTADASLIPVNPEAGDAE